MKYTMEITYKDYVINQDAYQYILQKKVQVKVKDFKTRKETGEVRDDLREVGYFTKLSQVIKKIAETEMLKKHADSVLTLQQYIKEYSKVVKDFKNDVFKLLGDEQV